MISSDRFDFWIKNGLNVLLSGKHGVGKTAMVVEAFNKAKLKWKYFSAATMDPWCDFIGVPKEKTEGGITFLDLVRPKEFQTDQVEALFFDELNRAHKKVRNAVMELIQFKSINGKQFKNLKIVWAAINPDDEKEYDVEKMDPAQKDRFHVQIEVPYKCDLPYFKKTYGDTVAGAAIEWWNALAEEQRSMVSPRRLDYAIKVWAAKGDVKDVLSEAVGVTNLVKKLNTGTVEYRVKNLFDCKDWRRAEEMMKDQKVVDEAIMHIRKKKEWVDYYLPYIDAEKIASLIGSDEKIREGVERGKESSDKLKAIASSIEQTKLSKLAPVAPLDGQMFMDRIVRAEKTMLDAQSDSFARIEALDTVYRLAQKVGTDFQAEAILKVVNYFARRSHSSTINKVRAKIVGIIAVCGAFIMKEKAIDKFEFNIAMKKIVPVLFYKIGSPLSQFVS